MASHCYLRWLWILDLPASVSWDYKHAFCLFLKYTLKKKNVQWAFLTQTACLRPRQLSRGTIHIVWAQPRHFVSHASVVTVVKWEATELLGNALTRWHTHCLSFTIHWYNWLLGLVYKITRGCGKCYLLAHVSQKGRSIGNTYQWEQFCFKFQNCNITCLEERT